MSPRVFLKLLWLVSLLSIFGGFTFLSWGVSKEYFEYHTSSYIVIRDYAEEGVKAPGLVVCTKYRRKMTAKVKELFTGYGNYLNDMNDTWKVIEMVARVTPGQRQQFESKKFLMEDRYCLFVQVQNLFRMDVVLPSRVGEITQFYTVIISMSPVHSNNTIGYANRKCSPKFVNLYLVGDESMLTNPRNRLYGTVACSKGFSRYNLLVTYSSFINNKLPPPFHTNCLEYSRGGPFLSSHHCYDSCLKEKTKEWNVIPDITLIDREKYNQSDAHFANRDVMEDEGRLEQLEKKKSLPQELRQTYVKLRSKWKGIKKSCRQSCYRPDCRSEDISTQLTQIAGFASANSTGMKPLRTFRIVFMTAYQPTLEVFTFAKQSLFDFIIYMSSMLSFWLGFCPLSFTKTVIGKLKECTKKKRKTSRRIPLEELVHSLDEKVRRLEMENMRLN